MIPLSLVEPEGSKQEVEDKLEPDFRRAIEFLDNLLNEPISFTENLSSLGIDIWEEGSVFCSKVVVTARQIPKGKKWLWNQSKSKRYTKLPGKGFSIEMCKLLSRKKKGIQSSPAEVPSYKIWNFYLSTEEGFYGSILWCEKGNSSLTIGTYDQTPLEFARDLSNPNEVKLHDYYFLAEFMDEATATSIFGFTNPRSTK